MSEIGYYTVNTPPPIFMIPVYPVGFRSYYSFASQNIPINRNYSFYTSWEDGLWNLLDAYSIPKGSTILIPDFYCMDVVKNMMTHGLVPVWYPVDMHFQTDPYVFSTYIRKYAPDIIVIFHAVGITNSLLTHIHRWRHVMNPKTLLIEDAVHKIINPRTVSYIHDRHFIMDSLRKVTPGMGSRMFGKLPITKDIDSHTIIYQHVVFWWWLVYQFLLQLKIQKYAEKAMLKGYDKIGDSYIGANGWNMFDWLSTHIDYDVIYEIKIKQVKNYEKLLVTIFNTNIFYTIQYAESDRKELRGFPIRINNMYKKRVIEYLRKNKLYVRLELEGSPWSEKYGVLYLPLGPHVSQEQQQSISTMLKSFHE